MLKRSELDVLNCIVESPKRHTVYSLAKSMNRPQSTVFNLVKNMQEKYLLTYEISSSVKNVQKKNIILTELGFCEYVLNSSRFEEATGSLTKKVSILRELRSLNICTECIYSALRGVLSEKLTDAELNHKSWLINSLIYVQSKTCGQTLYKHLAAVRSNKYCIVDDVTGEVVSRLDVAEKVHEVFTETLFENMMHEFPIDSPEPLVASLGLRVIEWFKAADERVLIEKYLKSMATEAKRLETVTEAFQSIE